ncbi:unnamed protein product [Natator depressus]
MCIYCRGCLKSLFCSSALLDSEHSKLYKTLLYCNIQMEIEQRQEELGSLNKELTRKKAHFEDVCKSLKDKADHTDQVRNETKELIQKRVEHMVRLIREKEKELLEMVKRQHHLGNEDLEGS